jgi:hypothetical protein
LDKRLWKGKTKKEKSKYSVANSLFLNEIFTKIRANFCFRVARGGGGKRVIIALSTGYCLNGPLQTCRQLRRYSFWDARHYGCITKIGKTPGSGVAVKTWLSLLS